MNVVLFVHSVRSCWNHGNAHFLRGIMRELMAAGHAVRAFQPEDGWSEANLIADHGTVPLIQFAAQFPTLSVSTYCDEEDVPAAVADADLVLVHEWNEPWLIGRIGTERKRGGRFLALFHDTHHRAVSDPAMLTRIDLSGYDGVLAFGEALAAIYRRYGWGDRVFAWHEAADTSLFHPPAQEGRREGVVWIGNWGDGERTAELETYLLAPCAALGLPLDIHGVRYPPEARERLVAYGARYHGWLPNASAPDVFARHMATIHVPRRFYTERLPGIPTIRMFEALACGIPLIAAPWTDSEGLFTAGQDYLLALDGNEMRRLLSTVAADAELRAALATSGLATILARHSCAHRVRELMTIVERLGGAPIRGSA
jgi:spore maturation protein CgeB